MPPAATAWNTCEQLPALSGRPKMVMRPWVGRQQDVADHDVFHARQLLGQRGQVTPRTRAASRWRGGGWNSETLPVEGPARAPARALRQAERLVLPRATPAPRRTGRPGPKILMSAVVIIFILTFFRRQGREHFFRRRRCACACRCRRSTPCSPVRQTRWWRRVPSPTAAAMPGVAFNSLPSTVKPMSGPGRCCRHSGRSCPQRCYGSATAAKNAVTDARLVGHAVDADARLVLDQRPRRTPPRCASSPFPGRSTSLPRH